MLTKAGVVVEPSDSPTISVVLAKVATVWISFWLGLELKDIHQFTSILVQIAVFTYTAFQAYLLARDKIFKRRDKSETSPGNL